MATKATIEFECAEANQDWLATQIRQAIKELLDYYHTSAKVTIESSSITFNIEGLWNG